MFAPRSREGNVIKTLLRTSPLLAAVIAVGTLMSVAVPAQAEGDKCNRASQCKGVLPQICVFCPKINKSVCAHHVCVHHTCGIETCPEWGPWK
jgi:hypothetical protein